jgi:TPR repeat protein
MYGKGQGVTQNYAESVKWYRLAAEQGDAGGQLNLGINYSLGLGVPQNVELSYVWLSIAAANGQVNAVKARDLVSRLLTYQEISEAQDIASRCLNSNYKDCP